MKNKRRVVRINENSYQALLEIQKDYEEKIGIKPFLSQLFEKAVADLFKKKLSLEKEQGK